MESELTRMEYLRLLQTAKLLKKERMYFLVKSICCVGLKIGELPQFTVEMVKAGEGVVVSKGTERAICIPSVIAEELLEYAQRNHISEGALFQTTSGQPLNRTYCFNMLRELAELADVPVEKCSPKGLRLVYLHTQKQIYDELDYIAKQAYEQLLAAEQIANKWREEKEERQ